MFHSYGPAVPQANALRCLLDATDDVLQQLTAGAAHQRIDEELHYQYGNIRLVLHPGEHMTWNMWAYSVGALNWFLTSKAFVEIVFDIADIGVPGILGTGMLGNL